MFQCQTCPNRPKFSAVHMLKEHVAVHHFFFTPYQCEQCLSMFGTEETIVEHYKNTHGMEQFTFKFNYIPGAFFTREKINAQMQNTAPAPMDPSYSAKSSASPPLSPQTRNDRDIDGFLIIDEDERPTRTSSETKEDGKMGPSKKLPPVSSSKDDLPSSSNVSTPTTAKVGNLDLSEFGDDSILRDDKILAEAIRKTEEFNQPDDNKKKISCLKCGTLVSDQRSSRFYHANTKHIRLPLYECKGCDRKWCTISRADVVKHVTTCHKGDESLIVDHKPRVRQQLRVLVELCFPKKDSSNDDHNISVTSEGDGMDEEELLCPPIEGKKVKEELVDPTWEKNGAPKKKKRKTGTRN